MTATQPINSGADLIRSAPSARRPKSPSNASLTSKRASANFIRVAPKKSAVLTPLDENFVRELKREDAAQSGRRLRIGLGRVLEAPLEINSNLVSSSDWVHMSDGSRVFALSISSQGAFGLRVHLEGIQLPRGATLQIYSSTNAAAPAAEVRNVSAGEDVWTDTMQGENVVVQCQIPASATNSLSEVTFSVSEISHIYRALKAATEPDPLCIPQIACYPDWLDTASGVAMIEFVDKGDTYLCTGCLLNDNDPSTFIDYFLTAHHCVPNKTVAATVEFFWFYQADACGNPPPDPFSVPHTSHGGALLATSAGTDFTLLQLTQPAPDNATFLGWSTAAPGGGDELACIQHPLAGEKRISFGNGSVYDSQTYAVQWTTGSTEEGSSGSPLLNSNHEVIGQLIGGSSGCTNLSGIDGFGRFDGTYKRIRHWIDNGPFISKQGLYNGLFFETNVVSHESSGFISLKLTDRGTCTGSLLNAGKHYSLSGRFDTNGTFSKTIKRSGDSPLVVNLALDLTPGAASLLGTVDSGTWISPLDAELSPFNAKTNPAPLQAAYNVVFPGSPDDPTSPGGNGFGALKVDGAGKVKVGGSLADNTPFTQSALVSGFGDWPFYVSLSGGKGSIFGWLSFTNELLDDLSGTTAWIKKQQKANLYPNGFTNFMLSVGSKYSKPATGASPLAATAAEIEFGGAGLPTPLTNNLNVTASGKFVNEGPNKLSLAIASNNGTFSGKVTLPSVKGGSSFRGAILQKANAGFGYFIANQQSGEVTLRPK